MSELYEKSLAKLELDGVLELLAIQAVSDAAKEVCRNLKPETDADEVRRLQEQTTAACKLISLKGSPSLGGIRDVGASLDRARRGGSLTPGELLKIASSLRVARTVKAYADTDAVSSCLDVYFWELTANKYLEDRISNSILSEEEIADSASSALADIRRHIRVQSSKIRESLQKIISSPTYSKALRESIVTIRSGRFVVPVKSECKNDIPGLVHDVSASGSTFFVEPMQAVNANNELRELQVKEQAEIERILAELSAEAALYQDPINHNYQMLVTIDSIFARAKLSYAMHAMEPEIRTDGQLELKSARHPLIDKKTVVPISVRLGSDFDTLVITGPNTGGKTVTLKTIGLLTLMAECGLHIPAEDGSYISTFDMVLADIGDEQSIEQSLSTFSAHMKNIVEIVAVCDSRSLVLFDELGAGTDPAEGAALAMALIDFCRRMGAKVAATTHYAELKLYAMRTEGVINASCEFDVQTLKPTYRLLIGVPGKSNAFAISQRLGLSEEIIKKARDLVSENDVNFEEVLNQLETQRQQMEQAKVEAQRLRREMEEAKAQSDAYVAEIKRERDKAVEKARAEAKAIIEDARRTANATYDELKKLRKQMHDAADAQGINERQAQLRRSLNEAEARLSSREEPKKQRPKASREIQVGDMVELLKLGSKATVLAVNKDGTYQLQAGIMKINAKKDEIYLLENEPQKTTQKFIEKTRRQLRNTAVPTELDLRGMDSVEAITVLDQFLDQAIMAKVPSVRIIHGKGTGVLRKAVQTRLRQNRQIKGFRLGVYGEGEDGVTIVEI
ncbi:MAG TPA: endonuclease MutS2 [Candidatus Avoscillospira avistercoris]|uniref:Endonuclease MutS2 n=1 Tax=Candidatus Avoscillospira avistercoris TaxID=2840707 RepID=A0A9D1FA72_9FIRM|nr:endonuclease MutS2 [Candidatus Avoscillospira avistercoris]